MEDNEKIWQHDKGQKTCQFENLTVCENCCSNFSASLLLRAALKAKDKSFPLRRRFLRWLALALLGNHRWSEAETGREGSGGRGSKGCHQCWNEKAAPDPTEATTAGHWKFPPSQCISSAQWNLFLCQIDFGGGWSSVSRANLQEPAQEVPGSRCVVDVQCGTWSRPFFLKKYMASKSSL